MKGYITNIEKDARTNQNFRKVLYTDRRLQLVVMTLKPGEDIGEETHELDQFIRVERGEGKSVLDGESHAISQGFAIVIPAGTKHNIINTSTVHALNLYTLYAPPNHKDGTVHANKADAQAEEHH